MYRIYILIDPISKLIRYVGCTSRDLPDRLYGHIDESKRANNKKSRWIRGLTDLGHKPMIVIIDQYTEIEEALRMEQEWIRRYRSVSIPLLNYNTSPYSIIHSSRR